MADLSSNVDKLSDSQSGKMVNTNELFDAASNSLLFGRRGFGQTANLTWAMYGGIVNVGGTPTRVGNCTITLTANATNYIEFDPTNTGANSGVTKNTSGFTAGRIRLYQVVVDVNGGISNYLDYRLTHIEGNPRLALSMGSDANVTLTDAQARAVILDITSSATLTATRDIVLPLYPRLWNVYNNTTGGKALRFIGSSGTGVTVENGRHALIYCDGTNVMRIARDYPGNLRVVANMASDANYTLAAAEAEAEILEITSTTLTAQRNVVVPLVSKQWTVFNNTTGAQSIQFIGASGTGIVVANGKRAVIYADGTNVVRVTADT